MKEKEMEIIAKLIYKILKNTKPVESKGQSKVEEKVLLSVHREIKELLEKFLLYPEIILA